MRFQIPLVAGHGMNFRMSKQERKVSQQAAAVVQARGGDAVEVLMKVGRDGPKLVFALEAKERGITTP